MHALQINQEGATVLDAFIQMVLQHPNRDAVVLHSHIKNAKSDKPLTYREFDELINRIANRLVSAGANQGSVIGILMDPSVEMLAAIFAIWKVRGAYLPLSKEMPKERVDYMLSDSEAELILTSGELIAPVLLDAKCEVVLLNADFYLDQISASSTFPCDRKPLPSDSAYIIYTSGSTGLPKGVLINHSSLMNAMNGFNHEYPMLQDESFLFKTPLTFDACIVEYLWPLLHGCKVVIIDNLSAKNPDEILNAIYRYKISRILFVPSLLSVFLRYIKSSKKHLLSSVRHVFVGGEVLYSSIVLQFNKLEIQAKLINCYGPTETTIASTLFSVDKWNGVGAVPIGKAMLNVKTFVIGENGSMVAPGEWGELCISGFGVSQGYINRADLNAEKFISTSYVSDKLYRTGDIVRELDEGSLEYRGRLDDQVKIRGFRIELGEIESVLQAMPGVITAAVVVFSLPDHVKFLCAYYSATSQLESEHILNYLAERLPEYMIPSHVVYLNEMPMMSSGKINRKALLMPSKLNDNEQYTDKTHERDTYEVQQLIVISANVLGISESCIGINDNFYALGGNSLRLIEMAARVQDVFHIDLPFEIFFENTTIAELVRYLTVPQLSLAKKIIRADKQEYYPLTAAQMRMYLLYLTEPVQSTRYNVTGMLSLQGSLDAKRLESSLVSLMIRHVILRTSIKIASNGMPVQVVNEKAKLLLSHSICKNYEELTKRFGECKTHFDLAQFPLIKFQLVQLENNKNEHILMFDADHIIFDGMSIKIFIDDLFKIYHEIPMKDIEVDYIDYAMHENTQSHLTGLEEKKQFWNQYLSGFIPARITPDRSQRDGSAVERVHFDSILCNRLDVVCKQLKISRFAFIASLFILSIHNENKQNDLTFASAYSNRGGPSLSNVIGNFVNVLLMRSILYSDEKWSSYVSRVMTNLGQLIKQGDYPYQVLSEDLKNNAPSNKDYDISILINHFSFDAGQRMHDSTNFSHLKIAFINADVPTAKYDISLYVFDTPNGITFDLVYVTPLYNSERMKRIADNLVQISHQVVDRPDVFLSEIKMDRPILQIQTQNAMNDFEFDEFDGF